MDYYDPFEVGIDDLVKRIRVGKDTREFLNTSIGQAIVERATNEYKDGIRELQKMSESRWSFSPEKEIQVYRDISDKLSCPINILKWLASVITTGENAETISRYKTSGELEP
jgi:hypothetical protein